MFEKLEEKSVSAVKEPRRDSQGRDEEMKKEWTV